MMSGWWGSRYTAKDPLRRPPWFAYADVVSYTFSMGTMPSDSPLVPWILEPRPRMSLRCRPMPPPNLESCATSPRDLKMLVSESSTWTRKQLARLAFLNPALNRVGLACVNLRLERAS
ncbi:hypothetical protein ATCV1_z104R [Acanthocystis turfacea chlorella virus 1]|uniref:Uncharacterized protein z104R n=1 Tax=Chlorovirus heliozoae TaxID=322019 RepID=A7K864_9PHYC|nr:hypothetical protein ATCV1_z104R [Acanthocystis turfacea chlorella virus 1]ABT16238.1 hypothetical protein ATCV1_z104R [Acanthocystis turfacea chlorella virus 1]